MQAGEERKAGESPTFEQLLEAASRGRSKYDAVADKIELLRAGGVTLRAIASWVEAQGIKSEVGELGQWLKRRHARQEKLMAGVSEVAGQSAPQAAPQAVLTATPTPSTTMKPNPSPAVFRSSRAPDPSDRPGTSEHEKELDARIEKALQESRAKRSPFALKSKTAEKK